MSWVIVALLGYFFNAVAALLDKLLLSSGRIQAPAAYAFFVSLFSLFAFVFVPFGFGFFGWGTTARFLISGMLFVYGLVALYGAIRRHEISRVSPIVGTVASLFAFAVVFVPAASDGGIVPLQIFALILLIVGGLLVSFDLPLRPGEHLSWLVLPAGILTALSLLLLKSGYGEANFVSGLVWSRLGMFLGGMSLLFVPTFRREILEESHSFARASSATLAGTGTIFVANKLLAGAASFLIVYAVKLGPVAFVQALSGMQYVFLLALAVPLAFRFPRLYGEKLSFSDGMQKSVAILLVALGFSLLAINGVRLPL